jgi:RES domain-containing protein
MEKQPEPGVQELFDAIASCLPDAVAFGGIVFRSVGMQHANSRDLFSGAGAATYGGRWNPRGLEAVYASLSLQTAVREAYQNFLSFGFPASSIRPRILAGAKVSLEKVLDLTDRGIRRRLGFSVKELIEEDWQAIQNAGEESWTQAIGRGAWKNGFEGLLVPSSRDRPAGINLVAFPGDLRPGSSIEILGEEDLPPHPAL